MTTLLQTQKSSLIIHDLDDDMVQLIEECIEKIEPELLINPPIILYGKQCYQHRSIMFYSNTSIGYYYSGKLMASKKLHKCLADLLDYINKKFNFDYNGILINKYCNGADYIGKHSDDEKGLDSCIGVVALSYGAVRKFRIRNKITDKIEIDIPTEPNKIIQMKGDFQKEFTHEIPPEKKITEPRYSFTFRKHIK
jgi:alkylated DNA repair dioxygenase AlkB